MFGNQQARSLDPLYSPIPRLRFIECISGAESPSSLSHSRKPSVQCMDPCRLPLLPPLVADLGILFCSFDTLSLLCATCQAYRRVALLVELDGRKICVWGWKAGISGYRETQPRTLLSPLPLGASPSRLHHQWERLKTEQCRRKRTRRTMTLNLEPSAVIFRQAQAPTKFKCGATLKTSWCILTRPPGLHCQDSTTSKWWTETSDKIACGWKAGRSILVYPRRLNLLRGRRYEETP